MNKPLAMSFDTEPSTPVRNALLNTQQRVTSIFATEIRTPAQATDYYTRLGAWCAENLAVAGSGGETIGSAHG